jgi:hypothetical protein
MPDCPPITTADQVADLLAVVAAANGRVAAEAGYLIGSMGPASLDTLQRLSRLADELRPGLEARAVLSRLEPDLLLAGTSVWLGRRRQPAGASALADSIGTRPAVRCDQETE